MSVATAILVEADQMMKGVDSPMPKSKGRKPKPASRAVKKPSLGRNGYDPGQLGIPPQLIANMLAAAPPDQLVEMLPPMLWLHHSAGVQANMCVSAALTLANAYELIGIQARPTAVELIISHRTRGELTRYGGGGASWDGDSFNGHCVLWLPGSGRWIDATVMQYPEVRASMPLPVVGRMAGSVGGSAASRSALAEGRLTPGIHMAVPREELTLDYTVIEGSEVIITGAHAIASDIAQRFRGGGINLVSAALEWWRKPGIVERVRDAPYPRLHALLAAIGDAPVHRDADDDWFFETTPGTHVRVDEMLTTT
ncbi:hypothetical protein ACQP2U_42660 (plasmid) [Nocardia sp. CA-084685]|uniref:hypothetical protein n=1 Tax=Nocardia sp. CA-084685 TaxID=3239970 RepID=UPI003D98E3B0